MSENTRNQGKRGGYRQSKKGETYRAGDKETGRVKTNRQTDGKKNLTKMQIMPTQYINTRFSFFSHELLVRGIRLKNLCVEVNSR